MADTAFSPSAGAVVAQGFAPTAQVSNSPTIQVPYGSVVVGSYPPGIDRWTVAAAAATTWTPV